MCTHPICIRSNKRHEQITETIMQPNGMKVVEKVTFSPDGSKTFHRTIETSMNDAGESVLNPWNF